MPEAVRAFFATHIINDDLGGSPIEGVLITAAALSHSRGTRARGVGKHALEQAPRPSQMAERPRHCRNTRRHPCRGEIAVDILVKYTRVSYQFTILVLLRASWLSTTKSEGTMKTVVMATTPIHVQQSHGIDKKFKHRAAFLFSAV